MQEERVWLLRCRVAYAIMQGRVEVGATQPAAMMPP